MYNKKWEKTQNIEDITIILEIQYMKLFLTKNIYAFHWEGGGK